MGGGHRMKAKHPIWLAEPEAHTAHMTTNKAPNNWDQLNDKLQKVCLSAASLC